MSKDKLPVEFFLEFFTIAMIQLAVVETNRYARQAGTSGWVDVTSSEIMTLLALQIFFGVFSAPEVDMYFGVGTQAWGGLIAFRVSDYMSRHRYWQLLSHLHFADNSKIPDVTKDRTAKVKPLLALK